MWHVWENGEVHTGFSEGGGADGKILRGRSSRRWENNIKIDLYEVRWGKRTGLIMPRMGKSGRLM
jgi:hypothetical protein